MDDIHPIIRRATDQDTSAILDCLRAAFEPYRLSYSADAFRDTVPAPEAIRDRLANISVAIARRVGETDTLYGSVTASDIADVLAEKGFEIDRRKLQLGEPLKRLGDFDIPVKLHRDVTATLKVQVVAEGSDT